MDAIRIQARFVIASPQQVYHPGQIVVRHGRIVEVSSSSGHRADIDLQQSALLPGLINAHTHLEFSGLQAPFPAGASFPDWIGSVVEHRRASQADLSPNELAQACAKSISKGLSEAHASGTAFVGDIATPPWRTGMHSMSRLSRADQVDKPDVSHSVANEDFNCHLPPLSQLGIIAFPEVLGLQTARFEQSCAWAIDQLDSPATPPLRAVGISPHSPYSLSLPSLEALFRRLPRGMLVAMHVAESRAEVEWLEQAKGAFRAAFERLDMPLIADRPQIEDCIRLLSATRRGLLVHGNCLTDPQIASLATLPNLSVVYCPRTHAHFGHADYPLRRLLEADVRVCLGTDSRASNPDLNLWKEVVEMRRRHPWLTPELALASATQASAAALGIAADLGELAPGKQAAACVVPCPADWGQDSIIDALTSSDEVATQIRPLRSFAPPL